MLCKAVTFVTHFLYLTLYQTTNHSVTGQRNSCEKGWSAMHQHLSFLVFQLDFLGKSLGWMAIKDPNSLHFIWSQRSLCTKIAILHEERGGKKLNLKVMNDKESYTIATCWQKLQQPKGAWHKNIWPMALHPTPLQMFDHHPMCPGTHGGKVEMEIVGNAQLYLLIPLELIIVALLTRTQLPHHHLTSSTL